MFLHNAPKSAFWRSCDQFVSDRTLDHFLNHFLHVDDILGFREFVTAVAIDVLPGDQGNLLECCCALDVTDALLVWTSGRDGGIFVRSFLSMILYYPDAPQPS